MPADQQSRNTCGGYQVELIDRVAISRWKSPWVAQEVASPRDSFMQLAFHPDIGFVVRRASMASPEEACMKEIGVSEMSARWGLHSREPFHLCFVFDHLIARKPSARPAE
jgi:hypothetical protein